MKTALRYLPGILLCFSIALPAWFLGKAFPIAGGPVFGILAGMVMAMALPRLLIRPAGVMWHKNRNLSPAARLMLSCLEETAVGIAGRADDEGNEVSRPLEGS